MPKKKIKNKKFGFKRFALTVFLLVGAILFHPTTLLLGIGMLPTIVAYIVDRSPEKSKTFTIGAMNFAGCFPYLTGLWMGENTMNEATKYLSDPKVIIFIYGIAALGYIINWFVTATVASALIKKSEMRLKRIEQEKDNLVSRWGQKVNGEYDLDENGFVIEKTIETSS